MASMILTLRALAAAIPLAFATGLAIPVSAGAEEITIEHASGQTAVPRNPETVLVFGLASLDTLDTIGVAVDGVPRGPKPEYLSKYNDDTYPKIGSLFEPDYEAVNASDPDLIIVGGRSRAKYDELSAIAPTIDMTVDPQNYIENAKANARSLGRIFGKEDEVAKRLDALNRSLAVLRDKAKDVGTGLIVLTTGGRMSAYGPRSRFGIVHDVFGITPAVPDLDVATHGQAISNEFILKTDPDWLFVIDRDAAIGHEGEAAHALLDNPLVNQTKAWKKGHVVYLDPANWYLAGSGLTALQAAVDEVHDAIAGD